MSARDDGGPVSPTYASDSRGAACNTTFAPQGGMSLRDWFAGQALAGLISKLPLHDREGTMGVHAPTVEEIHGVRREVAQSAYDYADAMLEARKGGVA